jgi:hypothetical protein
MYEESQRLKELNQEKEAMLKRGDFSESKQNPMELFLRQLEDTRIFYERTQRGSLPVSSAVEDVEFDGFSFPFLSTFTSSPVSRRCPFFW